VQSVRMNAGLQKNALLTPGRSIGAKGSPFNPEARAGEVYAGNPGTASLEHANSEHAVSQYDIAACKCPSRRSSDGWVGAVPSD
jgi:hypothetical protein